MSKNQGKPCEFVRELQQVARECLGRGYAEWAGIIQDAAVWIGQLPITEDGYPYVPNTSVIHFIFARDRVIEVRKGKRMTYTSEGGWTVDMQIDGEKYVTDRVWWYEHEALKVLDEETTYGGFAAEDQIGKGACRV